MGNTLPNLKFNQTSEKVEERVEEASTFTCEICIEPVSLIKRFKSNKKCSLHFYCVDCIAKYIQAKIEEYNMCPGLDCYELLDPLACRSTLPLTVFVRWCDVLCELTVLTIPKAYCPYLDCSALVLNECVGTNGKTKCPNCKKWFCFECKIPWHAGYRCNETGEMRDQNDVLLGQLLEANRWKHCPVCRHGVELSYGCLIVRCRCGTRFCYYCGSKWCLCKKTLMCRLVLYLLGFAVVYCIIRPLYLPSTISSEHLRHSSQAEFFRIYILLQVNTLVVLLLFITF